MLGSSLGSRKLLEGGLDAVLDGLVRVSGKRPKEIGEFPGGNPCEGGRSQNEFAVAHLVFFVAIEPFERSPVATCLPA